MIPVKVDRQLATHRSRWSPAGKAALLLVPPDQDRLAYPVEFLTPLPAVLIDEEGVVRWARPREQYRRLEARGLPAGRYRLRWGYDGFHPREAAIELRDGETTTVALEPF